MFSVKKVEAIAGKALLWVLAGVGFCSGLCTLLLYMAVFVVSRLFHHAFEATVGLVIHLGIMAWMCIGTIPERVEERMHDCRFAFKMGRYRWGFRHALRTMFPGFSIHEYFELNKKALKQEYRGLYKDELENSYQRETPSASTYDCGNEPGHLQVSRPFSDTWK